jgi:hypothetical protein
MAAGTNETDSSNAAQRTHAAVTFGWRASRGWSWSIQYAPEANARGRGHATLCDAADAARAHAAEHDASIGRMPAEALDPPTNEAEEALRAALEGLRFYADKRNYRRRARDRDGRPSDRSSVDDDGGAMARVLLSRLDPPRKRRLTGYLSRLRSTLSSTRGR